jgi:carbonic anhydrase
MHVVDTGTPVHITGMRVSGGGELIYVDWYGAVVIPSEVIADLENAIATVESSEAIVLGPTHEPCFYVEKHDAV